MSTDVADEGQTSGPIRPCSAALGIIGTPAVRWNTKADLYEQLERARTYLDSADLLDTSVAKAAEEAGISLHHFVRLFHERYATTPLAYLCARRRNLSSELLLCSEMSVSQISLEAGFESPSAFGRWFRREFGASPSEYRRAASSLPQSGSPLNQKGR